MGDRLVITGLISPQSAVNAMLQTDILINIGNSVSNQLPSKLIDYISTGKPIVNICKLEVCPSLKYMKRYPLCLNVFEGPLSNTIVNKFVSFCENNVGKSLIFDGLLNCFSECTPDFISGKLVQVIKRDD